MAELTDDERKEIESQDPEGGPADTIDPVEVPHVTA